MRKKISIILLVITFMVLLSSCKASDYKNAMQLFEEKDYVAAAEILTSLGDYKDSSALLDECNKMIRAIDSFSSACKTLESKNNELNELIDNTSAIVYSDEKALDESLRPNTESAISDAKAAVVSIPSQPEDYDEIIREIERIEKTDYTSVYSHLQDMNNELSKSIQQYALVNNPSEAYIINCLKKIDGVMDVAAATEDNDPNGKLHKAGGYTAAVFFSYDKVNQNSVYGSTIIEKGTDCGGQLEVYGNEEDAQKRDEYLKSFDGSVFSSGSHRVIGTIVVRTSDQLTASQQQELESKIIEEITKVE